MAQLPSGSPLKGARDRIGNMITYDLNGFQGAHALPSGSKKVSLRASKVTSFFF